MFILTCLITTLIFIGIIRLAISSENEEITRLISEPVDKVKELK